MEMLLPLLVLYRGNVFNAIRNGKPGIGDNDLLKMHMLDSAIKMNIERGRGKLVKLSATSHIDGMAALIDAMTVRQKWYGEIGEMLKNGEDNGDV